MKYTLLIALFAAVAIASAFPSDAETAKAEETETKVEATETKAEGTADDAMAAAKETLDAADQGRYPENSNHWVIWRVRDYSEGFFSFIFSG